jgi:type I restriction enzyme S subunit
MTMSKREASKVPTIRFKGFAGEWEPHELGEITTKIGSGKTPRGGKTGYLSTGIPLIRSQNILNDLVSFEGVAFISDETDEEMSNSRVLQDDVLLNITGASIGRSAVYRASERANVNQHVCIIRPNGNHYSDFIQVNLVSARGQAAINNSQAGGAREGLNFQQIAKFYFHFPSYAEQTKIGSYFRRLDQLILQHQHKHDKLVTLKLAMLQKMFPQPGTTTPEIRFKEFEGEWVEKELGELMPITSAARVHKHEWTRSGVPFFRTSDVVSLYKGEENTKAFISLDLYEKLSEKNGRIKCGDILITGGGSIGIPFLAKSDDPLYFKDADLLWLKVPENIDSTYLYTFFSSIRFREYLGSISHIGTIGHYTIEQAKKTPIAIPLQAEQKKIGIYFRQLDELISRHATQLEKLKQVKGACLEKMFI